MGYFRSLGRLLPVVGRKSSNAVKQNGAMATPMKHFMIDGVSSRVVKSIDVLLERVPPAAFHVTRLLEHLLPDQPSTGQSPYKKIGTLIKVINQRGATNPALLKDEARPVLISSAIEIIRHMGKDETKLTAHLAEIGAFDDIPADVKSLHSSEDASRIYVSTQAVWHLLYQLGMTVDFKTQANKWTQKSIEANKDFIGSSINNWDSMDFSQRMLFVKKIVGAAIDQTRDLKINIKSPGLALLKAKNPDFASYSRRHVQGDSYYHELAINKRLLLRDPTRPAGDPTQPIRLISCIHHELTHAWQYSRFEELEQKLYLRAHKNLSLEELEHLALLLCCELDLFLRNYPLNVHRFVPPSQSLNLHPKPFMYLPHEVQAWSVSLMALKQLYMLPALKDIQPDVIDFVRHIGHQFEWLNQRYLLWDNMEQAIARHQPGLNDLYPSPRAIKGL